MNPDRPQPYRLFAPVESVLYWTRPYRYRRDTWRKRRYLL